MSILIKGMEMPKSCGNCFLGDFYCPQCQHIDGYKMIGRPYKCPLVPVPPHGDLIDADALEQDGWIASRTYQASLTENVYETKHMNAFPAIIEAEGDE